ncbi:DODA-type extradiol aromatic ring-opening family dioxygenase [Blastopirellula retiformator]|uniref:LigB family dioxygenase n=1 Tax=Blastopirellula retiformator TaxID=2527970 RepID=A0A5C5UWC4_9BACT|nr:class III extradiol ring-cleavage dioxygenase [Blastopirellula retiformator]TWT29857.1 LigB family dioxygenase [Blastopirellula retiformator]
MPAENTGRVDRRTFNAGLVVGGTTLTMEGLCGTAVAAETSPVAANDQRLPTIFVAHGSPELAVDPVRGAPFAQWGQAMPAPKAIMVVSAHWEKTRPVMLSSTDPKELVYDFGGFPRPLYEVRYDAPGAKDLATRVESLLPQSSVMRSERGLDHGAWTPLVHMYPKAEIPVLQVSMPSAEGPRGLFEFGRALAPLRDEGVLIIGSGNITHPMLELRRGLPRETPTWAGDFDAWAAAAVEAKNYGELINYAAKGPDVRRNHPTPDHFLPLLVVAGVASVQDAKPKFVLEEFEYNLFSRRSIEFV